MKGKILDYNIQESKGIISGDDGQRYNFENKDWKGSELPKIDQLVDFETEENQAKSIYALKIEQKNGNTALLLLLTGLAITSCGLYFAYLAIFDIIDVFTLLNNTFVRFQNSIDNSVTKFIIITIVESIVALVLLTIGLNILKSSSKPQEGNFVEVILKSISINLGDKK